MQRPGKPPDQQGQQEPEDQGRGGSPAENEQLLAAEISSALTGKQIIALPFLWSFAEHTLW